MARPEEPRESMEVEPWPDPVLWENQKLNVLQLFENLLREDIIRFKKDSHLENDPRRGMSVRWLAGFTVTIKLELLATIISVTWKDDMCIIIWSLKQVCISHKWTIDSSASPIK